MRIPQLSRPFLGTQKLFGWRIKELLMENGKEKYFTRYVKLRRYELPSTECKRSKSFDKRQKVDDGFMFASFSDCKLNNYVDSYKL